MTGPAIRTSSCSPQDLETPQLRPGDRLQNIPLDGKPFTVAGGIQSGFMLNAEVMPSEEPMDKVDLSFR